MEFETYSKRVNLGMDFCPLAWWDQSDTSQLYPSIKKHVKKYFCVPSFVNNVHRMSLSDQEKLEQIYERHKNDEPQPKIAVAAFE